MKKSNHIRLMLCIIMSIILSTGCATTLDVPANQRTKVFSTSYSEIFRTTIQVLSEEGYLIDNTDRETGIITTDYSEISNSSNFLAGDRRTKLNAVIQELNKGIQVRLTMSVQSQDSSGKWEAKTMSNRKARTYYNMLFEKISSRL